VLRLKLLFDKVYIVLYFCMFTNWWIKAKGAKNKYVIKDRD